MLPVMAQVIAGASNTISGSVFMIVTSSGETTDWGAYPDGIEITLEKIKFFNATSGTSITLESRSFFTYIGWFLG